MIIDCISDLHGFYPKLEVGDLLIVAGDCTSDDKENSWNEFETWLVDQKYKDKILVAGNHDNFLASQTEHLMWKYWEKVGVTYLQDSLTEIEGLKIWGTPWTLEFEGMNPECKAFTCKNEYELGKKFRSIPIDTDILVTHSPPHGMMDQVYNKNNPHDRFSVGSVDLRNRLLFMSLKLHVFGHIHESYGKVLDKYAGDSVNASHVNEFYKPVNRPIRIVL